MIIRKGYNLQNVATKSGISRNTLYAIFEKDECKISTLVSILDATKISMHELFPSHYPDFVADVDVTNRDISKLNRLEEMNGVLKKLVDLLEEQNEELQLSVQWTSWMSSILAKHNLPRTAQIKIRNKAEAIFREMLAKEGALRDINAAKSALLVYLDQFYKGSSQASKNN